MQRDDMEYILGTRNEYKKDENFFGPFTRFCQAAKELRINLSLPIGGYHDSMDNFVKNPGKPDFFFSLDPTGNRTLSSGDYLIGFQRGYYGELGDLPERMTTYANENALTLSGPVFVTYLFDEICVKDPIQYLAQACVAVAQ